MRTDDDTRTLEQEVAAGQSETTPVAVITSVIGVIAGLVAVALVLAVVAYVLA
jgi:capsular polysaccharide biosynthesis protein